MKLWYMFLNWVYSSWVGDLWLRFLIWKDDQNRDSRYLTPTEVAQIIRESHQIAEGVLEVKRKVNSLVKSKTKEEYHRVLCELEDMIKPAEYAKDHPKAQFAEILRRMNVKNGNVDIVTPQEKLEMINKRIEDYKELHDHIEKRNLIRKLRKAKAENDEKLTSELKKELDQKYGKRYQ